MKSVGDICDQMDIDNDDNTIDNDVYYYINSRTF